MVSKSVWVGSYDGRIDFQTQLLVYVCPIRAANAAWTEICRSHNEQQKSRIIKCYLVFSATHKYVHLFVVCMVGLSESIAKVIDSAIDFTAVVFEKDASVAFSHSSQATAHHTAVTCHLLLIMMNIYRPTGLKKKKQVVFFQSFSEFWTYFL